MCNFEKLNKINVNEKTEKRKGDNGKELTYLSWAWAWAEFMKVYPSAKYEIKKFENDLPYIYDEKTGYMVFTSVTVDDVTHEMWLPVMNSNNRAMKSTPYDYTTKYGTKTVESATMFDINKTIMRCLTKNLAMFGLGLYIYAGEDLPEDSEEENEKTKPKKATPKAESVEDYNNKLDEQLGKEQGKLTCSDCGAEITEKVANFSHSAYGKALCFKCQKLNKKLA